VIVLLWMGGLLLVRRLRKSPKTAGAGNQPHAQAHRHRARRTRQKKHSTASYAWVLLIGGLLTLLGGVVLEGSGRALADHWGVSGVVFGATALAAATSLPEISTGLASIRLGDDQMAISDIFGGNAFLPVLFLAASLLSGHAVLPQAKPGDLYLAALGIVLTAVYLASLVPRPRRRILGLGVDSWLVLGLYGAGVAGLLAF
jgi:cation:H+ antiporter